MGDDGWAVYSKDGSLAAHFEFTIAVTADGPRILTPWHERTDAVPADQVFGPADQDLDRGRRLRLRAARRPTTRRSSRRSPARSRRGLPAIQVSPPQGKLLQLLARSIGARTALEFGTLGGYSTIWLGRALPDDGRLITLESEPAYAEVARANIERAGLAERRRDPGRARRSRPCQCSRRRARAVRPRLHRRRQGQHARVLRLVARAHPPRRADRRRQRRPRRRAGRRAGHRARDRRPAPLPRDARREPRVEATTIQTVGGKGYDGFAIALVK